MSMGREKRTAKAELARQAIEYLAQHDLVLRWEIPEADPPPADVRRLIMSCLAEGEVDLTTSALLCEYLVTSLREDYLPVDEPSRSEQGPPPWSSPGCVPRRPGRRVAIRQKQSGCTRKWSEDDHDAIRSE